MTVNGPQSEISNSGTATQLSPLSGDVGAARAIPGLVPDQPAEPAVERATPGVFDNMPANTGIAVCCSDGGIRSTVFKLGALQPLQECDDVYSKVRTVTAVSGGSYIAAAHVVAEVDLRGSAVGEARPSLSAHRMRRTFATEPAALSRRGRSPSAGCSSSAVGCSPIWSSSAPCSMSAPICSDAQGRTAATRPACHRGTAEGAGRCAPSLMRSARRRRTEKGRRP